MAERARAGIAFGLDGGLDRQRVHHGRQHADRIRPGALDPLVGALHAAKEIAAAHHDGDFGAAVRRQRPDRPRSAASGRRRAARGSRPVRASPDSLTTTRLNSPRSSCVVRSMLHSPLDRPRRRPRVDPCGGWTGPATAEATGTEKGRPSAASLVSPGGRSAEAHTMLATSDAKSGVSRLLDPLAQGEPREAR